MPGKPERWCATHKVTFKNKWAEIQHKRTHTGCQIGWRIPK